jgi:hypothetical protein
MVGCNRNDMFLWINMRVPLSRISQKNPAGQNPSQLVTRKNVRVPIFGKSAKLTICCSLPFWLLQRIFFKKFRLAHFSMYTKCPLNLKSVSECKERSQLYSRIVKTRQILFHETIPLTKWNIRPSWKYRFCYAEYTHLSSTDLLTVPTLWQH